MIEHSRFDPARIDARKCEILALAEAALDQRVRRTRTLRATSLVGAGAIAFMLGALWWLSTRSPAGAPGPVHSAPDMEIAEKRQSPERTPVRPVQADASPAVVFLATTQAPGAWHAFAPRGTSQGDVVVFRELSDDELLLAVRRAGIAGSALVRGPDGVRLVAVHAQRTDANHRERLIDPFGS